MTMIFKKIYNGTFQTYKSGENSEIILPMCPLSIVNSYQLVANLDSFVFPITLSPTMWSKSQTSFVSMIFGFVMIIRFQQVRFSKFFFFGVLSIPYFVYWVFCLLLICPDDRPSTKSCKLNVTEPAGPNVSRQRWVLKKLELAGQPLCSSRLPLTPGLEMELLTGPSHSPQGVLCSGSL